MSPVNDCSWFVKPRWFEGRQQPDWAIPPDLAIIVNSSRCERVTGLQRARRLLQRPRRCLQRRHRPLLNVDVQEIIRNSDKMTHLPLWLNTFSMGFPQNPPNPANLCVLCGSVRPPAMAKIPTGFIGKIEIAPPPSIEDVNQAG